MKIKYLVSFLTFITSLTHADVVTDWNSTLLGVIRAEKTNPPAASRNLAMMHVAIFEAVNGINPTYTSYYLSIKGPHGASTEAAASVAAHDLLVHLYPARQAEFDVKLANQLAPLPYGKSKQGIEWGSFVAGEIIRWRQNDGANQPIFYEPNYLPGMWRPTPPLFAPALLPHWSRVMPFAMTQASQFRPSPPPILTSEVYTAEFDEVKRFGSAGSTDRTSDQTEIAKFWANGAGTATPPGHWNQIAQIIVNQRKTSLEENAALFALLNIALADAAISCWETKYLYNYWRPVSAIREADSDGNEATISDPAWTPLLATPPFPECTSGHSTFSAAAGSILAAYFGTDEISFSTSSDGTPGLVRHFTKLSDAVRESGLSRIYGGIHFQTANVEGQASGVGIGNYVSQNFILPLKTKINKEVQFADSD
jgi:hypothetical protein